MRGYVSRSTESGHKREKGNGKRVYAPRLLVCGVVSCRHKVGAVVAAGKGGGG